jgi:hypothetical protein
MSRKPAYLLMIRLERGNVFLPEGTYRRLQSVRDVSNLSNSGMVRKMIPFLRLSSMTALRYFNRPSSIRLISTSSAKVLCSSCTSFSIISGNFAKKYVVPTKDVAVVSLPAMIRELVFPNNSSVLKSFLSVSFRIRVMKSTRLLSFISIRRNVFCLVRSMCATICSFKDRGTSRITRFVTNCTLPMTIKYAIILVVAKIMLTQEWYCSFFRQPNGSPKVRSPMRSNVVKLYHFWTSTLPSAGP